MIGIRSDKIILADAMFDGYVYIKDGSIFSVTDQRKGAVCWIPPSASSIRNIFRCSRIIKKFLTSETPCSRTQDIIPV